MANTREKIREVRFNPYGKGKVGTRFNLKVFDTYETEPGDTDPDYFQNYNTLQREFCDMYAEDLSLEVIRRFGE